MFQQDERYHQSQTSPFLRKGPSFGLQDFTSCTFGVATEAVLVEMQQRLQKPADSVSDESLISAERCPCFPNVLDFTDGPTTWNGFSPKVREE